jgi:Coenzyme PQQ synthesis protein D (PqqD)
MNAKRVDGLLIERPEGELLVLKEGSLEAHALNETAAIVFDLCDGETSRAVMAAEVARRTGLPADESIIDLALSELADAGLVVLDEAESPGITRRSLIRRLALPAAALALLPIVETILMPSAASGASVPVPTATGSPSQSPSQSPCQSPCQSPSPE